MLNTEVNKLVRKRVKICADEYFLAQITVYFNISPSSMQKLSCDSIVHLQTQMFVIKHWPPSSSQSFQDLLLMIAECTFLDRNIITKGEYFL